MSPPVNASVSKVLILSSTSRSVMPPNISVPTTVLKTLPLPPARRVPPITTPAIAVSSYKFPAVGVPTSTWAASASGRTRA